MTSHYLSGDTISSICILGKPTGATNRKQKPFLLFFPTLKGGRGIAYIFVRHFFFLLRGMLLIPREAIEHNNYLCIEYFCFEASNISPLSLPNEATYISFPHVSSYNDSLT